ncbi:MAG: pilus assembly protein PilM [Deltaproteobacteria bacterium]|nr:pilus assembly protein PilM [Deltaproteobacteria bacterium]
MAERILGLDIGESALKAVVVMRSFQGAGRIVASAKIPIDEQGGAAGALEKLFADERFAGSSCSTVLAARNVSFRRIDLPFQDSKRIAQTVAFELEPLIPFPIDEVFISHLASTGPKGSKILAAIAPKTVVRERAALVEKGVRTLSSLDAQALPVAAMLLSLHSLREGLVLDIGAKGSIGIFIGGGQVVQVRHFAFGADALTKILAKALRIDEAEAEKRKQAGDFGEALGSVQAFWRQFFAELKRTFDYLQWNGDMERMPPAVYLTGGGAFCAPLREALAQYLCLPVECPDLAAEAGVIFDEAVKKDWQPSVMNQALALALRPHRSSAGFDFRGALLRERRGSREWIKKLPWVAAVAAAAIVLAGLESYLDYRLAHARLSNLKAEISASFKQCCPEITRIVDPVSQLKAKIGEMQKLAAGRGTRVTSITVLEMLRDLSLLAPKSSPLLITAFNYENDLVSLKGETENFDAVEVLKREIERSKYFKTVLINSTNIMKQGDRVEFEMRMVVNR